MLVFRVFFKHQQTISRVACLWIHSAPNYFLDPDPTVGL